MANQNFVVSRIVSSNNDTDISYFSSFFIHKHMDKIDYSSSVNEDEKIVFGIIKSVGYKRASKRLLKKGKYSFKDTYKRPDDISIVEVIYQLKSDADRNNVPAFLITVHDPTQELINLLSSSCVYLGINLKVSKIELAYDFYSKTGESRTKLFDFLKTHLLLKHSRSKPSEKYSTTYYANNLKRSSKGLKVYLRKDHFNKRIVRLELTLKRTLLKKLRIDPSLKAIDSVNPFDFFLFMSVDDNGLINHLKWKSRRKHKNDVSRNKFLHHELLERHVENYVCGFLLTGFETTDKKCKKRNIEVTSLMGKVHNLKSKSGVKNYIRFLSPHKTFTQIFIKKTMGQEFLVSKVELK